MALLEVSGITKDFRRGKKTVRAVDGVSFSIEQGQTMSLIGESGSGQSTVGRVVLGLLKLEQGNVVFDGKDLTLSLIHI